MFHVEGILLKLSDNRLAFPLLHGDKNFTVNVGSWREKSLTENAALKSKN